MKLSTGKTKPKEPRFRKGDQCHHWRVIEHVGHGRRHPQTGRYYSKSQHYYRVQCQCGNEEIRPQNDLSPRPGRTPPACVECKTDMKSRNNQKTEGHISNYLPDFAKMKL